MPSCCQPYVSDYITFVIIAVVSGEGLFRNERLLLLKQLAVGDGVKVLSN